MEPLAFDSSRGGFAKALLGCSHHVGTIRSEVTVGISVLMPYPLGIVWIALENYELHQQLQGSRFLCIFRQKTMRINNMAPLGFR